MAGIGFQLKRLLRDNSFLGFLRAYSYAGILTSGPWLLAVIAIIIISGIKRLFPDYATEITQFQVSITYLMAASLCFSGLLQFSFTRYISDLIFTHNKERIIPNFCAALCLMLATSGIVGIALDYFFFTGQPIIYQFLLVSCFVIFCANWFCSSLLSGLRIYNAILSVFFLGYLATVIFCYVLFPMGLTGLMLGLFMGQTLLLVGMIFVVFQYEHSHEIMDFDFIKPKRMFASLMFVGLFYNMAVWADKVVFWFSPSTGIHILGPLYACPIYDFPIFTAYLTMIPGMAVFLFRLETDFVEHYDTYYHQILNGGTIQAILASRQQMVTAAYSGLLEIAKVQGFMIVLVFLAGQRLLVLAGMSPFYIHLLNIATVAAALQVIFLGILNVLFYLDKRRQAVVLTLLFLLLNIAFTLISIHLGVHYYGYGLAISLLISNAAAFLMLDYDFRHLEYTTFMLR
jgi:polysaccharide biosynthesis protein PelG